MKIYISGPITGYDFDERLRTFTKARKEIEKFCYARDRLHGTHTDYEIFSPPHAYKQGMMYEEIMRHDMLQLLESDYVCFLQGWQDSRGCKAERAVAECCGIRILFDNMQP